MLLWIWFKFISKNRHRISMIRKNTGFWGFYRYFEKIPEILIAFLRSTPKVLYLCKVSEPYQISAKIPVYWDFTGILKEYRFFGILPVFWKITQILSAFLKYAQRFIPMQSFRVKGKFLQKYRFFIILPVFLKKCQKFWYNFRILWPKLPYFWKFQGNRPIFQF